MGAPGSDLLSSETLEWHRKGVPSLSLPGQGSLDGIFQAGRQLPRWLFLCCGESVWELVFTELKGKGASLPSCFLNLQVTDVAPGRVAVRMSWVWAEWAGRGTALRQGGLLLSCFLAQK